MHRILIFANGELPSLEKARTLIRAGDYIIAVDGGIRHILALKLIPAVIIGDLDSLPSDFQLSTFSGELIRYPRDKNETDLELAIQHTLTLNPEKIIIIAALGGRLDQTLANISLLADQQLSGFDIRLNDGVEEIFICRAQAQVIGISGDIISLIPWGNPVTGIQTTNLKWALNKETLFPEKTRGISNEMTADEATISIESGLLVIVRRY